MKFLLQRSNAFTVVVMVWLVMIPIILAHSTQIRCVVTDDPLTAVARGTGLVLEDLEALQEVLLPSVHNSQLR